MAIATYRSKVPVTRDNIHEVFAYLCEHLNVWGIDLIQITKPTLGPDAGYIVITLSDTIPNGQADHLSLTLVL